MIKANGVKKINGRPFTISKKNHFRDSSCPKYHTQKTKATAGVIIEWCILLANYLEYEKTSRSLINCDNCNFRKIDNREAIDGTKQKLSNILLSEWDG